MSLGFYLPTSYTLDKKQDTSITAECEETKKKANKKAQKQIKKQPQTYRLSKEAKKAITCMSATEYSFFWLVASNLQVCEIGYETFRKCAWLIFHAFFSWGQDTASPADTKSNRCQTR